MAFQLAWRTRIVVLMVPTWPESGFREGVARLRGRGTGLAGADGNRRYRAGWADEGEGRVLGGRGREFGINGESSGKDGVNTNRRSSLVFFKLRRVTCGVAVHKAVDT